MTTEPDSMRADRPLLLLLAALTAGCADPEPFVDMGSPTRPTMEKPRDPVLANGTVSICFSDKTPWAEVEALAAERCQAHGLKTMPSQVQRYQCRATSPHTATFICYDPEMLNADGTPINVFDRRDVQAWEKRTGKRAKPHNALGTAGDGGTAPQTPAPSPVPTPATPAAPEDAAPTAPAPIAMPAQAPLKPLTPADIAGHPPFQPLPPRTQTPAPLPAPEAYPADGFTLPQGSWGDAFRE